MSRPKVGDRVRSLRSFVGINKGDEGVIIEDYGTGVCVAWEPYPRDIPLALIVNLYAVDPACPQRDGFGNDELDLLEVLE